MLDLIAKLSAAPSGSRDLDAEVAIACGWRIETRVGKNHSVAVWVRPDGVVFPSEPPLTTDLTTIVGEIDRELPGCVIRMGTMHKGIVGGWMILYTKSSLDLSWFDGYAQALPTPEHPLDLPRAGCIALLKAKEATHD